MTFEELMKLSPGDIRQIPPHIAPESRDCTGCTGCTGCTDCHHCWDCPHCWDCRDCRDCTSCKDCWDCTGCRDCTDCTNCHDCHDCTDCMSCWGLKNSKIKQYVVFGAQLTADQWAQFLAKMNAPRSKRENDDV